MDSSFDNDDQRQGRSYCYCSRRRGHQHHTPKNMTATTLYVDGQNSWDDVESSSTAVTTDPSHTTTPSSIHRQRQRQRQVLGVTASVFVLSLCISLLSCNSGTSPFFRTVHARKNHLPPTGHSASSRTVSSSSSSTTASTTIHVDDKRNNYLWGVVPSSAPTTYLDVDGPSQMPSLQHDARADHNSRKKKKKNKKKKSTTKNATKKKLKKKNSPSPRPSMSSSVETSGYSSSSATPHRPKKSKIIKKTAKNEVVKRKKKKKARPSISSPSAYKDHDLRRRRRRRPPPSSSSSDRRRVKRRATSSGRTTLDYRTELHEGPKKKMKKKKKKTRHSNSDIKHFQQQQLVASSKVAKTKKKRKKKIVKSPKRPSLDNEKDDLNITSKQLTPTGMVHLDEGITTMENKESSSQDASNSTIKKKHKLKKKKKTKKKKKHRSSSTCTKAIKQESPSKEKDDYEDENEEAGKNKVITSESLSAFVSTTPLATTTMPPKATFITTTEQQSTNSHQSLKNVDIVVTKQEQPKESTDNESSTTVTDTPSQEEEEEEDEDEDEDESVSGTISQDVDKVEKVNENPLDSVELSTPTDENATTTTTTATAAAATTTEITIETIEVSSEIPTESTIIQPATEQMSSNDDDDNDDDDDDVTASTVIGAESSTVEDEVSIAGDEKHVIETLVNGDASSVEVAQTHPPTSNILPPGIDNTVDDREDDQEDDLSTEVLGDDSQVEIASNQGRDDDQEDDKNDLPQVDGNDKDSSQSLEVEDEDAVLNAEEEIEEYEPNLLDQIDNEANETSARIDDTTESSERPESNTSSETTEENIDGDNMAAYEPTLLEDLPESSTKHVDSKIEDNSSNESGDDGSNASSLDTKHSSTCANETIIQKDVVSFIEEVIEEDVRSWVPETDSFSDILGNKTRGGYYADVSNKEGDVDNSEEHLEVESMEASTSELIQADVSLDSDTSNDGNRSTFEVVEEKIEAAAAEEDKAEKPPVDRLSLETSEDKATDAVVSVVTWNLAEESPSEDDAAFIRKFRKTGVIDGTGSDLVLISGQECENIKPRRSEGRRSREFRRLMVKMLGMNYVPIAMHLLGGIQFGLFCKKSFLGRVQDVFVADVTCGIGNVFHNKGAIAAFVTLKARNDADEKMRSKQLRMMFVTAHMAAHVKNFGARDSDFWRISSELEAQAPEGFLPRKTEVSGNDGSFLFDSVDRVFFCGDLNYRLDLPRELAEHTVLHGSDEERLSLLRHDQLIHSMAEGRAFPGFAEGKISFSPTFKFDKESSGYDTSHKQRIPAWTDRVLFKPNGVRVLDYDSIPNAKHSDHRPVFGTFRVNMEGRQLPTKAKKKSTPRKKRRRMSKEQNDR